MWIDIRTRLTSVEHMTFQAWRINQWFSLDLPLGYIGVDWTHVSYDQQTLVAINTMSYRKVTDFISARIFPITITLARTVPSPSRQYIPLMLTHKEQTIIFNQKTGCFCRCCMIYIMWLGGFPKHILFAAKLVINHNSYLSDLAKF